MHAPFCLHAAHEFSIRCCHATCEAMLPLQCSAAVGFCVKNECNDLAYEWLQLDSNCELRDDFCSSACASKQLQLYIMGAICRMQKRRRMQQKATENVDRTLTLVVPDEV